jgi:protein-S-isoprenylcysteine O-methyltransferase Ste14
MWQWRPIPARVWLVASVPQARLIQSISIAGWVVAAVATFTQGQMRLFGLSQSWAYLRGHRILADDLRITGVYRLSRHPMYLGFVVAIWATPVMSVGHLEFAILMTAYVVAGSRLEEAELRRSHGVRWEAYRSRTPVLPGLRPRRRSSSA